MNRVDVLGQVVESHGVVEAVEVLHEDVDAADTAVVTEIAERRRHTGVVVQNAEVERSEGVLQNHHLLRRHRRGEVAVAVRPSVVVGQGGEVGGRHGDIVVPDGHGETVDVGGGHHDGKTQVGGVGGTGIDNLHGTGTAQCGKLCAARLAVGTRKLEHVDRLVGGDHRGDGRRVAGHVGVTLPLVEGGCGSCAAVDIDMRVVLDGDDAEVLELAVVVHGDEEVAGVLVGDELLAHEVLAGIARELVAGHGVVGGVHRDGLVGGDARVGEMPRCRLVR